MRVTLDQRIALAAEQAQAVFIDPAFYRSLGALPNISAPEVRSLEHEGGHVRLVLGYHFSGSISGPARRILDPSKISWYQETDVDVAARCTRLRMVPDHYKSLLSFHGWYRLDEQGPDLCTQHLEAELAVHIPLLGPLAERAIASGIRDNLATTAGLVESHAGRAP